MEIHDYGNQEEIVQEERQQEEADDQAQLVGRLEAAKERSAWGRAFLACTSTRLVPERQLLS